MHVETASLLLQEQRRQHCAAGTVTWISTAASIGTYREQAASDLLRGVLINE